MNKSVTKYSIIAVLFLFAGFNICFAEEEAEVKRPFLKSVDILTGFGKAHLRVRGDYEFIPVYAGFNFDLKPLIEKTNIHYWGLTEFQIEPFIALVYEPQTNVEVGNTFMFKLGLLPETSKFQPYINAGIGFLYMSQHTNEQATQFNFEEQGGLGAYYFFRENVALNMNCRIRHVSNAGMYVPNQGINSLLYLLGVSYRF